MKFWINHPRTDSPDAMLTLATLSLITVLVKFLFNGVVFTLAHRTINCGTVDAMLVGAILTPTLGAYVARKMKDSPDAKATSSTEGTNK